MKFNKKCQILHLGQIYVGHKHKSEEKCLESSLAERDLGVQLSVNQERVLAAKRKNCILVHQTQHHQPVKRGDYTIVFSFGAASASSLCAGLGPTI